MRLSDDIERFEKGAAREFGEEFAEFFIVDEKLVPKGIPLNNVLFFLLLDLISMAHAAVDEANRLLLDAASRLKKSLTERVGKMEEKEIYSIAFFRGIGDEFLILGGGKRSS